MPLIIALGLFSIAWGLFWLYKPLFLTIGSQYNIFEEIIASNNFTIYNDIFGDRWINLLKGILAGFLLVRAGIGLIKLKSQAGIQFWMAFVLHLLFSGFGFIMFVGWSGNQIIFTLNIAFIFTSFLIFLWPNVSEHFPHRKAIKWKTSFPFMGLQLKSISLKKLFQWQLIILTIIIGFAYYGWRTYDIYRLPPVGTSKFKQ